MITEAIILAGGLGTRLRSAVPDLPKCMAPVNGRPFLSFLIDYLRQQGIQSFIFSLGHRHEVITLFLKNSYPGLPYKCSVEDEPLGTGGAVLRACSFAAFNNVIVVNGDTLFAVDIHALSDFHIRKSAECSLSLKPIRNSDRYGVVEIGEDQEISQFHEKKWHKESLINGGVYALDRERFSIRDLPERFSFEKDYLEKYYPAKTMFGLAQDRYFIDIGIPDDYHRAQTELPQYV